MCLIIHWLYRTSRYAIVKVTERNDVTKRHGYCHQNMRRLESKCLHYQKSAFRNERYARKRIYHGYEGQIDKKKTVPRDHSLASRGKSRDARL